MLVLYFDWLPADPWSTYLTSISTRAGRKPGAQETEVYWRQEFTGDSKLNKTKPLSTSHKSAVSFNVSLSWMS